MSGGDSTLPARRCRWQRARSVRWRASAMLTSDLVLEQALDSSKQWLRPGGAPHGRAGGSRRRRRQRCTPEGRPANSAFLDVTGSDGSVVRISIPDVSPENPIPALRAAFDEWRATHPCEPAGGEGGAPGGNGGGGNGVGGSDGGDAGAQGCACRTSASLHPQNSLALGLVAVAMARRRCRRRSRARC
jgi:MYXO-CTERM domain-containing protein